MRPAVLVILGALLTGCGSTPGDGRLHVAATTTQVADLARHVAGARAEVSGILRPSADPHDFELRPHDVRAVRDAGLIVRSGGELDDWLSEAIDAAGTRAAVLDLAGHVTLLDGDPHWWQDPRNAIRAVGALRDAMSRADPDGAHEYARNAAAYTARLERLDRATAACIARLTPAQRTLVTTHDALSAYAHRYGLRIVGAVIPSRSTVAQPSVGDVDSLISTIRRTGVRAVFAENGVRPDVEQAIADASGAQVGRALWTDSLGPAGSDGATYLAAMAANTDAIVSGLSGGTVRCRPEA
jgi:zinc/manganese transport system substrate-binding protein/manganese/iron transport system substrate-binding protein